MGFKEQQAAIQQELDRITHKMNAMLPRYTLLLKRKKLSDAELEELGELEHFLIGLTSQIGEIKQQLEQDVFGHTIDLYYKIKRQANKGDVDAKKKLEKMRDTFHESMQAGNMLHWN